MLRLMDALAHQEVLMALQSKSLKAFDRPPKVTFAQTSLASAAVLFRQQDPKRHICIVNCCCGVMPPPLVGFHQETELYCQVPSLLASLCLPKPFVVCPFGPAAKKEDTSPKKQEGKEEWDSRFSTVVYSPDCVVCRNSVSEDFEALPLSSQTVVSVINSALPLKAQHGHLDTRQLEKSILETLTSAFATPVMRSPVCTTLIVGAWGCGEHFATQTETVATKLAELLAGKLVEHVRVGWLFSEVHFCFPHYDVSITGQSTKKTDKDPAIDIFRRIFDQHHINPRLL
ncbi:unnamed protein product [Effrenium voratum]|nr:unnamed protein product [Effrenium voratum]